MDNCVFCKMVEGKQKIEKVMEDDDHIAFLAANPVYDGMTIVMTKKHFSSYIYKSLSDSDLAKLHVFARKVALLLDKALGSERCMQVFHGLDVDHAHIKLFPKYPGVIRADVEKDIFDLSRLSEVAEKIRKVVS